MARDGDNSHSEDVGMFGNDVVISAQSRRKAMELLRNDAASNWKKLPCELQVDKELVLYVLRTSRILPPKSEFERKFPQSLRFDRDYVLAFANRDDFRSLYEDRRLYVPEHLKSDKEIMLAYCRVIPRALQDCTEDLADDPELVKAAVQLSGLELQYASSRLRENESIVRLACQNNGCAIEHCQIDGPTRSKLISDRDFMLKVILTTPEGGRMLQYAPRDLRYDRELLFEALLHGMAFRYCPSDLLNSIDFLKSVISRKSSLYLDLKGQQRRMQQVLEVAVAAVAAPDSFSEVHKLALDMCPDIRLSRDATLAIVERGEKTFMKDFLLPPAPEDNQLDSSAMNSAFLADKEIMCNAIQRDFTLYAYCDNQLRNDPDILVSAMTPDSAFDIIRSLPSLILREHPQIAVRAVEVTNLQRLWNIGGLLPRELWVENRSIAIAWIRRGSKLYPLLADRIKVDREMALEVAEYCWREFAKVGIELRSDLQFMTEAVDKCGCVIRFAGRPEIRNSLPLLVRAVASHPLALQQCSTSAQDSVKKEDVVQYILETLAVHETFVVHFLRGIAIPSTPNVHPSNRSQLPMLDRGVETSQAFKKRIAEFVGVPTGLDLTIIRRAHKNITNPPPHTSINNDAAVNTLNPFNRLEDRLTDRWRAMQQLQGFDNPMTLRRRRFRHTMMQRRHATVNAQMNNNVNNDRYGPADPLVANNMRDNFFRINDNVNNNRHPLGGGMLDDMLDDDDIDDLIMQDDIAWDDVDFGE